MTAPLDRPGEWTELVAHVPGQRITAVRAVRRSSRAARVGERAAARPHPLPRRQRAPSSTSATSRTTSNSTRTPSGATSTLRYGYQSFTTPAVGLRGRRGHRRARAAEADARTERRPVAVHRERASGRPRRTARACRSTSSGGATSSRRALRRAWCTATAATSRRCHRGSASPASRCSTAGGCGRWCTRVAAASSAGAGTRRQAAAQAQHVHRHHRLRRAPDRGRLGAAPTAWRSAAAAPAACWSARA